MRLEGKLNKTKHSRYIKNKSMEANKKNSRKLANLHKNTPKLRLAVSWNSKSDYRFEKKQSAKQNPATKQVKKQATFKWKKTKNKQRASL